MASNLSTELWAAARVLSSLTLPPAMDTTHNAMLLKSLGTACQEGAKILENTPETERSAQKTTNQLLELLQFSREVGLWDGAYTEKTLRRRVRKPYYHVDLISKTGEWRIFDKKARDRLEESGFGKSWLAFDCEVSNARIQEMSQGIM